MSRPKTSRQPVQQKGAVSQSPDNRALQCRQTTLSPPEVGPTADVDGASAEASCMTRVGSYTARAIMNSARDCQGRFCAQRKRCARHAMGASRWPSLTILVHARHAYFGALPQALRVGGVAGRQLDARSTLDVFDRCT